MRRRIIAEDPDWSITTVPSLSILCLQIIVNNFESMYNFPAASVFAKSGAT